MYYAIEVFNINEFHVRNFEDEEFLNMLDDIDWYKDPDKEVTHRKDEVVIKNNIYSTHYFLDEDKREEKINELKSTNNKILYAISSSSQSNDPENG